jgi:twitching motility two-component system response regulator PilG
MSTSPVSSDFQQGIASARAGHRLLARLHLAEAIDGDPSNDAHWLWMAWVAESPGAAVDHLKKALERNPDNEIAKAGLIWSQTMAEWDFERPYSPRATLAAVAEREARTVPASSGFPIRMPRVDELHADSSQGYEEKPKPADSKHDVIAEAFPELVAKAESPVVEETRPKTPAPAHVVPDPIDLLRPKSDRSRPKSENRPKAELEKPATDPTKPKTEPRRPDELPDAQAKFRPESLPIDQLTGMYMGEGKSLIEDQFAGFNLASSVDMLNDPSASLATPFPGGTTVGKLGPTRPPSGELQTPFGGEHPPEEPAEAASLSGSDSEFETITPTNVASLPSIEAQEPAPAEEVPSASSAPSAPVDAGPVASHASIDVVEHSTEGKPRKVMIVDDSPTVCKIVSITLKKRGFDVQTAADGVEAMALIATDQPDLILLDITMPRMDGYQLCKLIKGYPQTKTIPVIMLSGKDGFFDRVRGKLVGCSDYITKPFDPEMLVAAVERFLPAPMAAAAT